MIFRQGIFTLILICGLAFGDECADGNHELLDQWYRSVGIELTGDDDPRCDNTLTPGWYRPVSAVGNVMPTECPLNGFRCGTINPIWTNGTYPAQGQTKTVTGCVSSYNGGCCIETYNIDVRNCGDFYIYNLKPTEGCYKAYCFGNETKCPAGQTSDNEGFTPGCEFDPCHELNYKMLCGEEKRSSNYTLQAGDVMIEDSRLDPGWYRIDSVTGNDIVNDSVSLMQCSTMYPLWMRGTLPTTADKTVTRKVCKVGTESDCEKEYDIQVRNCGNYRTYNLPQLVDEKSAFCFGTLPVPEPTTTTRRPTTERSDHGHDDDDEDDDDDDDDDHDDDDDDNDKEHDKHKLSPAIAAAIALLSALSMILLLILVLWCYKTKSAPKRAVSFATFENIRPPSAPPSYEEANRQNFKNNMLQDLTASQIGPRSTTLHAKY